jgi:hypothetical protein
MACRFSSGISSTISTTDLILLEASHFFSIEKSTNIVLILFFTPPTRHWLRGELDKYHVRWINSGVLGRKHLDFVVVT